jgi:hypothetical protein
VETDRPRFACSLITEALPGYPASKAAELLATVRRAAAWDVLSILPCHEDFPRAYVSWHEGHGFVVQCFEDDRSWGHFLARDEPMSPPDVELALGGQAREVWPRQLFVDAALAADALEHFLLSGRQKTSLRWVRGDAFARDVP